MTGAAQEEGVGPVEGGGMMETAESPARSRAATHVSRTPVVLVIIN